jgi:hypothetical protein
LIQQIDAHLWRLSHPPFWRDLPGSSVIVHRLKKICLSETSHEWILGPTARGSVHQLLWDPNPEGRGRQAVINSLCAFHRCPQYLRAYDNDIRKEM